MKIQLSILSLVMLIASYSFGQVNEVNYGVKYNQVTGQFDVYFKVLDGHALEMKDRVQFNSQVSVVVPAGSDLNMKESFAPYEGNLTERSTKVSEWTLSTHVYAPAADPTIDIYSFTPSAYPTAAHNDMRAGDEVKLFSFELSPVVNCASDVRIFNNDTDPKSNDKGMLGGDHRNGFTMGGLEQKYVGNEGYNKPSSVQLTNVVVNPSSKSIRYNMVKTDLSAAQKNLSYEWLADGKLVSSTSEVPTFDKNVKKATLNIVDGIGCKESFEFDFLNASFNGVETSEESVTSAEEVTTMNFDVFPNPAKDFINVNYQLSGSNGVITLVNMSGSEMLRREVASEGSVKINLDYPSGIYNVNLLDGGKLMATQKVIIIK